MNDVLMSTVGGLAAFFFWGTSDWLAARSSKHYSAHEVNLAIRTIGLTAALPLLIFNYHQLPAAKQLLPFALVGVLFTIALSVMIKALSTGVVGIVVPIVSSNPLITLLLAIAFGTSTLNSAQVLSVLIIISGILLLSYQKNVKRISARELHRESGLAMLSAVFWGLGFFIINENVAGVPWQAVFCTVGITTFVLSNLFVAWQFKQRYLSRLRAVAHNQLGLAAGVMGTLGSLAFFYAAGQVGNVLILVVISAAAPLVAALLGAIYDHERLGYLKRLGSVLVVGGVILLNILK